MKRNNLSMVFVPTIPGREGLVIKVINNFLTQGVGKIVMLLNGYHIRGRRLLPRNKRIEYILNKKATGPISRFQAITRDRVKNFEYIFTVDDDIDYPKDYIEKNIDLLDKYGDKYIISYHAHYWKNPVPDYKLRITHRIEKGSNSFIEFPFGGSGASAFSKEVFLKIESSKIPKMLFPYNDDIWLSTFAKSNNVKFLRPPTKENWIKIQTPHPVVNLYNEEKKTAFKRRNRKLKMAISEFGLLLSDKREFIDDISDFYIYIKSYNRASSAINLINDIERNRKEFDIKVFLVNDCSSEDYTEVKSLLDDYNWEYKRFNKNHGKKDAWMVSDFIYSDVKNKNSKNFMVFSDDIRLCDNFFNEALERWNSILDKNKASMVLIKDSGRDRGMGPGPCWTGVSPNKINEEVWLTGWVDELFIAERNYFENLNYSVPPINKDRFRKNPKISSGVGRSNSIRLRNIGKNMYCVDKSLAVFINCNSEMNPMERVDNPLISLDFIMGNEERVRLENE